MPSIELHLPDFGPPRVDRPCDFWTVRGRIAAAAKLQGLPAATGPRSLCVTVDARRAERLTAGLLDIEGLLRLLCSAGLLTGFAFPDAVFGGVTIKTVGGRGSRYCVVKFQDLAPAAVMRC